MTLRAPSGWPALRAVLLTVVIVHGVLYGLPLPRLSPEDLASEEAAPFVSATARVTGEDPAGARERLRSAYEALISLRDAALAPLAFGYRALGAGQHWNMFSHARHVSFQMYVEAARGAGSDFETLYTVHDEGARFERVRLEYRRVRAAYVAFGTKLPGAYYPFARWISERALESDPEITEVRVGLRQLDYRTREERLAAPERSGFMHAYRLTRAQYDASRRLR